MTVRRVVSVRLTSYQSRILDAMQAADLAPGGEPPSISRVFVNAMLEAAKARGIKPAPAEPDTRQLELEEARNAG